MKGDSYLPVNTALTKAEHEKYEETHDRPYTDWHMSGSARMRSGPADEIVPFEEVRHAGSIQDRRKE